jgi:branched-subunit amino acid ABC-type transport system permease component
VSDFFVYVVIGITAGSIYGLIGVGLVLTYRTSGVFNFAQGGLATAGSYFFYELWVRHDLPWPVAAVLSLVVLAVVLGIGLEALGRRLSTVPQNVSIVATIGLLLVIEGVATVRYGAGTIILNPYLPTTTFRILGVNITWGQLIVVLIGISVSVGLTAMLNRTRIGTSMRGVVDDPDLLEITGIDAKSVRRVAWTLGGGVAVLSGILIAPTIGLNPLLLTDLVIQAFGAAAIGRFKSLPMTFVGGWIIGIGAALIQNYTTSIPSLQGLPSSLPFVVLLGVLLISKKGSLPTDPVHKRPRVDHFTALPLSAKVTLGAIAAGLIIAIPFLVGPKIPVYISAAGFVIVFLSLGLLIQTAGQISLCQGVFAAIGAVAFSRLTLSVGLPWPLALLCAGLIALPIGAVVAIPAIRVAGIYLALATFAFGILMTNLVYSTSLMFGAGGYEAVNRPHLSFVNLGSDKGYFYLVAGLAAIVVVAMVLLQRSRLGRTLRGLADSPLALTTFGISVKTTLIVVFCISAFLAGVGGAVLAGGTHAAGPADYGSLNSLEWVVILAISGRSLIRSSIVAAILLAILPAYLPQSWINYEPIGFGVLAIVTALLTSNGFDIPSLIKADLRRSGARIARSPVVAREHDSGWRSPASGRRRAPVPRIDSGIVTRVTRRDDAVALESVQ